MFLWLFNKVQSREGQKILASIDELKDYYFLQSGADSVDAVWLVQSLQQNFPQLTPKTSIEQVGSLHPLSQITSSYSPSDTLYQNLLSDLLRMPLHQFAQELSLQVRMEDRRIPRKRKWPTLAMAAMGDSKRHQGLASQFPSNLLDLSEPDWTPIISTRRHNESWKHNHCDLAVPDTELSGPLRSIRLCWVSSFRKCLDATPLTMWFRNGSEDTWFSLCFVGSHSGQFAAINLENGEC